MIRVAFDIGGVLSRYPQTYLPILRALQESEQVQVYVLTDMFRVDARKILDANGLQCISDDRLLCADWATFKEQCKKVLCEEHLIDLLIDDIPGYLTAPDTVCLAMHYDSEVWVKP